MACTSPTRKVGISEWLGSSYARPTAQFSGEARLNDARGCWGGFTPAPGLLQLLVLRLLHVTATADRGGSRPLASPSRIPRAS
jgi:hypothetical protein